MLFDSIAIYKHMKDKKLKNTTAWVYSFNFYQKWGAEMKNTL